MNEKADKETIAIILAAGQGTRMKSKKSKVLHQLVGKPMIRYVLDAVHLAGITRVVLVVGHESETIRAELGDTVEYATQSEQLGTGHAVMQAAESLGKVDGDVLVLYGDTPLVKPETLRTLVQKHAESSATITLLTGQMDDPRGYGRIVRIDSGIAAIVEESAASADQRDIKEINCGMYCFDAAWLCEHLPQLQKSSKGEYYLTDLIEMAAIEKRRIEGTVTAEPEESMGVNDRAQLAEAEELLRWRIRRRMMLAGVTLVHPSSVYIDEGVEIGRDTIVQPGTFLRGTTRIGEDCVIGPYSNILNSTIGNNTTVISSVIEDSAVEDGVTIGPFSHLRPGAHVQANAEIGNFAEIKNSVLGSETKMHHFSYIGDASVGKRVNIAAGTITCNFDAETGKKNRTVLEDDVAVGSDTMLVAPVTLGKGAMTGAGSIVTKDIPADRLAVGMPARAIRKTRRQTGS
jgi:bifunctional UDP-N-acetylglucosamine pyrophosphorylase/glucosamine-1-phosphate N-acetyltransferase